MPLFALLMVSWNAQREKLSWKPWQWKKAKGEEKQEEKKEWGARKREGGEETLTRCGQTERQGMPSMGQPFSMHVAHVATVTSPDSQHRDTEIQSMRK
jgi:hypothetical protein